SSMSKATVLFELQPTSIRHRPGSHPDAPPKRVERVALPPILLKGLNAHSNPFSGFYSISPNFQFRAGLVIDERLSVN
ncbi:hypothetical protein, partial [Phormidesmis priestleyi]